MTDEPLLPVFGSEKNTVSPGERAEGSQPPAGKHVLLDANLTGHIIGAFYSVYNTLGYGFLESVYTSAMQLELQAVGLRADREVSIDVWYRSARVGHFRADLLVQRRIVVESKASESISPVDRQQLLNYLRATNLQVGLLLHFGPKPAFKRVVWTSSPQAGRSPYTDSDESW